jgi:hypothetical protein
MIGAGDLLAEGAAAAASNPIVAYGQATVIITGAVVGTVLAVRHRRRTRDRRYHDED